MKKNLLLIILSGMLCFSCSKWLDVQPEDMIADDEVFSNYQGVQNAVNGIYINLVSAELYGRELTWGFSSALARDYAHNNMVDITYNHVLVWDYEHVKVKGIAENIWAKAYTVIANCNKVLEELEKKDDSFFQYGAFERKMITGEMKAIRGMLHLDLARLFAPAPITGDDGAYMPYYKTYGSKAEPKLPTSEILKNVIADFTEAKNLLIQTDTIEKDDNYFWVGSLETLEDRFNKGYSQYPFYEHRGTRMNYVAILGLLSRAHLWTGEKEEARMYAEEVLYGYGPTGLGYYKLNTGSQLIKGGWFNVGTSVKLSEGLLLAFYDKNLISKINSYKSWGNNKMVLRNIRKMATDRGDQDDARLDLIGTTTNLEPISLKWTEHEPNNFSVNWEYKLAPIIRLSEMYYILAECMWDIDPQKSRDLLNELRSYRQSRRTIVAPTYNDFIEELLWETRKEFFTEGQTFFMFKRLNENLIIEEENIPMDDNFVVPVPDNENIN